MMVVINSIVPVFALILLGVLLYRVGLTDDHFLAIADKLIYFLFFPILLFWKIGGAEPDAAINWAAICAVLAAVFVTFAASLAVAKALNVPQNQVGSFSQAAFRFSTYVGVAVILSAIGEQAIGHFGVLIGFAIPFINVLSVTTLIWYANEADGTWRKIRVVLRALVSNPLIIACLGGMAYASLGPPFPGIVANTFRLMSLMALPLALVSVGGSLSQGKLQYHLPLAIVAMILKLVFLPAVGYCLLQLFAVEGIHFTLAMIYFALPTSPAVYILSSQLNSDTRLATSAIIISVACSAVSLSTVLLVWPP
jgi:hypothetical protein